MVVRAGALSYGARIVAFNPLSGLYKVEFVTGYKGTIEWMPPRDLKTCQAPPIAAVSLPWFTGVWQLVTVGGGAWQKNPVTNSRKVVGLDVAKAPPIRISADDGRDKILIERTDLGLTYWGNRVGELNKPIQGAR